MTLEETAAGTPAATAGETGKAVGEFMRNLFPEGGVLDRLFTVDTAVRVIRVGLTIVVGILLVGLIVAIIRRVISKRLDTRNGAVIVKVVQYAGIALIVINAFEAAQVDLSALLGAAGIAGIAIGFAAQTSVSNFISGFFLVSDKTFAVGDILTVDGITGEVYAIETLSVKLKTFDNRLVRIPNETLIKSNVINVTRFPVRRLNIQVTVPHGTDIARARGPSWGPRRPTRPCSGTRSRSSWCRPSPRTVSSCSWGYGSTRKTGSGPTTAPTRRYSVASRRTAYGSPTPP